MAVNKILIGGSFYMTYPSGYVFGRERNYLILEEYGEQVYINSIEFIKGGVVKKLNFVGFDLLKNKKLIIDISAYYSFGFEEIYYNYTDIDGTIFNDRFQVAYTFLDCYDPFKEITGSICGETGMAIITPPFRMLESGTNVQSLFCAKHEPNNSVISYKWNINGEDDSSDIIIKSVSISDNNTFVAKYIRRLLAIKPNRDIVDSTITRSVDARDTTRDCVFVTWRTRWGLDVSHVFYLGTYATDKEDAQEVESDYYYEEHSKHVIKGSFYLDNIREPYDLWYYQTLANSELVVLTFEKWNTLPYIYMPNATNAFNGVKITGSNIKDAVVDGVAQSTITFNFELR